MLGLQLLSLACLVPVCTAGVANLYGWNNHPDPSQWHKKYPFCAGLNQSPVDICTDKVHPNPTLGNIVYTNFNTKTGDDVILVNYKGEQAMLTGFGGRISIREGGLPASSYVLQQLHFHVGSVNSRGSEHDINGRFFPAEMHLVFYSCDYPNYKLALNRPQGIAVLAVLFQVSEEDNPAYKPIIDKLCEIPYPSSSPVEVEPLVIRDLLPDDIKHFYRYRGSLTTPPCYQSVIWTIYKDLGEMSERQLNEFRTCLRNMSDNFRPTQPLNGRLIEENQPAGPALHCHGEERVEKCYHSGNAYEAVLRRPERCKDSRRPTVWGLRAGCYPDRQRYGTERRRE